MILISYLSVRKVPKTNRKNQDRIENTRLGEILWIKQQSDCVRPEVSPSLSNNKAGSCVYVSANQLLKSSQGEGIKY